MKAALCIRFLCFLLSGTLITCPGCRSAYPGYIQNKTQDNIIVSYKPYSFPFDSAQYRKGDLVMKKPDTLFHLSPRPVVSRMVKGGKTQPVYHHGFMEVVQVELKSGELVYIGDLPTALDWEELFSKVELSVIKGNESGSIKNPRTDFIRKKGIGVIYEIK